MFAMIAAITDWWYDGAYLYHQCFAFFNSRCLDDNYQVLLATETEWKVNSAFPFVFATCYGFFCISICVRKKR